MRDKNVVYTMFQSFVAIGVISVVWILVGYSLAFGTSVGGVFGNPASFAFLRGVTGLPDKGLGAGTIPLYIHVVFQMKFAVITPGAV